MLPTIDFVPVEEMLWMKREELQREFKQIRLQRAARISNPGLLERLSLHIAHVLMNAGQRLHDQYTIPRQSYLDAATNMAA
jgi:hypothetical protein